MTEWGVLWYEDNEIERVETRARAEALVDTYPVWGGRVVSRTVTYSEWEPVDA